MALQGEAWVKSPERRMRDLALVGTIAPAAAPLLVSGLALSRLIDGPHPLFQQQRVGKDGELFTIYKIRTMPDGHEDIARTVARDSRASTLGGFYRLGGIDEIPQVYNILKGDLSIIGPRALIPAEIEDMKHMLPTALFDRWLDIYMTGGPGCVSSYGHATHANKQVVKPSYILRAELDIQDFEHASRRHDIQLLSRIGRTARRIASSRV